MLTLAVFHQEDERAMHSETQQTPATAGDALPLLALLQHGLRVLTDEFVQRMEAAGVDPITPAHAIVLMHLGQESPLTVAELARRADVTRQTMHRAVMQLVDEGILTSAPGTGFPRSTLIGLTAAGEQRRDLARGILDELDRELAEEVGQGAVEELRGALGRAWGR
ncbi:MarR family winged helix-turn-helix transcriptional regulator [Brachybacterium sp. ACRRE]|uniref:MarR family winged helix-turn-helix transcriptional regulator n=1 Tax=Brachybacterium sp. ACRRE TaxID=2918184 RepID=UPI001EF38C0E|nr:MarR family transcriptional regulator [Brachybacterium sp. ACRRE]MCG7310801.1 MarR family transcriptional regulator [Brachybacterium sp. ACRRE]